MKALPKTIWVRWNEDGEAVYLSAETDETELLTNAVAVIGEYRLIRTRKRKLVASDA